jgi:hypothetical protein
MAYTAKIRAFSCCSSLFCAYAAPQPERAVVGVFLLTDRLLAAHFAPPVGLSLLFSAPGGLKDKDSSFRRFPVTLIYG